MLGIIHRAVRFFAQCIIDILSNKRDKIHSPSPPRVKLLQGLQ
jgi:phosphopantetheine adenylyltransferase